MKSKQTTQHYPPPPVGIPLWNASHYFLLRRAVRDELLARDWRKLQARVKVRRELEKERAERNKRLWESTIEAGKSWSAIWSATCPKP